jgi:beta-glucanase (GH16 family)
MNYLLHVLLLVLSSFASPALDTPPTAPRTYVFDQLVWSDEFDGEGPIDTEKWFHQTRLPGGDSWFNGEIQHYTDREENARVADGVLQLTARRENYTDQGVTKQFTSARLNSKFAFTYGRVEIRAKLPTGVGTWPAIWMLGKNISENGAYWQTQGFGTTPWPACGEIDIMEHWGDNQNFVQSAIHTPSSFGNTVNKGGQTIATVSSDFHVYALEWTPQRLIFSVDDIIHYVYNPPVKNAETWPFDADQYLLLNIAIQPHITPSFTSDAMEIDYVRVYQESATNTDEAPRESIALVYPNPVGDVLTLTLTEEVNDGPARVEIYTLDGKRVRNHTAQIVGKTVTVSDLADLPAGQYLVAFTAADRRFTAQIVKE